MCNSNLRETAPATVVASSILKQESMSPACIRLRRTPIIPYAPGLLRNCDLVKTVRARDFYLTLLLITQVRLF